MSLAARAILFPAPGEIEFTTLDLPPCGEQEVIAETIYTFVSPGTELRVLAGTSESKGRFPLIPGYAWVGRIIEVGSGVKGWQVGELVTGRNPRPIPGITQLWGGQASHHRCEVTGYDAVLKLPAGADPWDYVMTEVAAISWRGVSAAFPAPGETAVVVGQGLIGAFNARWLLAHGARVIVVDLEQTRLERARRWGVVAALNGRAADIREQVLAYCPPGGADIAIDASASLAGARLAASVLRQPVYRSLHEAYPVGMLRSAAAIWPRLVFQATYTWQEPLGPGGLSAGEGVLVLKPGDRTVGDRLAVIDQIRTGNLPVADLLEAPTPVEQAPEAYRLLRDHPEALSAVAYAWQA